MLARFLGVIVVKSTVFLDDALYDLAKLLDLLVKVFLCFLAILVDEGAFDSREVLEGWVFGISLILYGGVSDRIGKSGL